MYYTIFDIKKANKAAGYHFFESETMAFFSSRIESDSYDIRFGKFFVTSEQAPDGPRLFTVREVDGTGRIHTVGGFQSFATLEDAFDAIDELLLLELGVPID